MAPPTRGRPQFRLFSHLKSMQELQETLDVTENQLWCVELEDNISNQRCAHDDCIYPAVKRNARGGRPAGPRCVVHAQNWFPKNKEQGSSFYRGHFCLGPQYFRPLTGSRKTCCCENEWCIGIGYSSCLVMVPVNVDTRQKVAQTLGVVVHGGAVDAAASVTSKLAEQLIGSGSVQVRDLYLAPWHFSIQYRQYDEVKATWRMKNPCKFKDKFIDSQGEIWTGMPPCDYDPKRFVEEEMHGKCILPKNHPNLLMSSPPTTTTGAAVRSPFPSWVGEYLKAEGMDVIHTLDTLDIPPSLAPFSLADVNHQWQTELGPEETAKLKRQRTSSVAANNTITTTTTTTAQQPLAGVAAAQQHQSPEQLLLKEIEKEKQNLCMILKARDKEIETLKETIDELVKNR